MGNDFYIKILVIAASIFAVMYIFSNFGSYVEGARNMKKRKPPTSNLMDGVAGNASNYGANIKAQTIKLQDTLLVNKYRSEYENAIINLNDMVNVLMLKQTLSISESNPAEGLEKLTKLNEAKTALNSVMKYIDST
jgi:hypothetical protein